MRQAPTAEQREVLARRRAQLIVQVRSGLTTAQEAARQLGVSRKTYYKWERRALAAMISALSGQAGGRPPTPVDPEKEALRHQVGQLQQKVLVLEQTMSIRDQLASPDIKKD